MAGKITRWISIAMLSTLIWSCQTSPASTSNKQKAAELKMQIGVSHLENNNLPLALKELLSALEMDPKNPYIHNNLGIVYYLREKFEASVKYFNEAILLLPTFTEAKNNLARVYIERKQYAKASPLLEEIFADLTYTNIDSASFNYALFYFNQKKYEQAKSYLLKILNNNREDCLTLVYYARTLMETGYTKQATEQLEKATHFCVYEKSDEAHFYLAIAEYRLGKKTQSLAHFEELVKIFPAGKHRNKAQQMIQLIRKEKK